MARKLRVPVVAIARHDRTRMVGDIYGLEQQYVREYVKRGLVKLNLKVLENPDAPEDVKDLVEQFQAELHGTQEARTADAEAPVGGRQDPNLKFLNDLPYNRGKESVVGFAKAVAEHLGLDGPPGRTRDDLTGFLLTHFEALEELRS